MKAYITDLSTIDPEFTGLSVALSATEMVDCTLVIDDPSTLPDTDPLYWSLVEGEVVDNGIPLGVQSEIDKEALKLQLALDLEALTVTLDLGNGSKTFAISPDSKYKYETVLKHLDPGETNGWTLADGTYDLTVTKEDLEEALRLGELAGIALENAYHLAKSQL